MAHKGLTSQTVKKGDGDMSPGRTPEQRKFIDSHPVLAATDKCNARITRGEGYCKNQAGYGTNHLGSGRCKFHGGSSDGAPIITGQYSKKLKSSVREEYEALINDPNVVELKSELALAKTMFGQFVESIRDKIEDPNSNFWVDVNNKGNRGVSAEANVMVKLMSTLSNLFQKVSDAESKAQEHLDIKDIYNIVIQIRNVMDNTCSTCPVRAGIGEKLTKVKVLHKN